MTNTIKRAGKAIGGGNLWRVYRGATVIGTVTEISVGWVAQRADAGPNDFTFVDTKDQAFAAARGW